MASLAHYTNFSAFLSDGNIFRSRWPESSINADFPQDSILDLTFLMLYINYFTSSVICAACKLVICDTYRLHTTHFNPTFKTVVKSYMTLSMRIWRLTEWLFHFNLSKMRSVLHSQLGKIHSWSFKCPLNIPKKTAPSFKQVIVQFYTLLPCIFQ